MRKPFCIPPRRPVVLDARQVRERELMSAARALRLQRPDAEALREIAEEEGFTFFQAARALGLC